LTSRRKFLQTLTLGSMGAAVSCTGGRTTPDARPGTSASLALLNGRVYTMDEDQPMAEAFAILDERFAAVGSTDEIEALIGVDTQVIDAHGMTVVPGFIDAHSHPDGVDEVTGVNVNLGNIADIKEVLRAKAAEMPPNYWVSGYMYDDTKLAEGRPVLRSDLDEAVPDHPAVVLHRGGHTAVCNSRAFEIAGITAETPDPPGGKFYRDENGLTGKVAEHAMQVFRGVGKRDPVTRETRQAAVEFISAQMAAAGLTSVTNALGNRDGLIACQDARAAGNLKFRVYFMPFGVDEIYRGLKMAGVRTGFGDEMVRIGAAKFSADGSASERTMRMSTPFVGRPDDYGILTMTQEEIHEAVEDAHLPDRCSRQR
jgi:predicted amidohydrolase YtcJ